MVLVTAKGDYGKTRPAVIVQDSRMAAVVESVTVCFLTSDLTDGKGTLRINVMPSPGNGLRESSQVQVEKLMTFPREKVRGPIGVLDAAQMGLVDVGLLVHLGLAVPLAPQAERNTSD